MTNTPMSAPVGKPRLDCLTSLRFFAAMEVVFFHYAKNQFEAFPGWLQGMLHNGYQAVVFFFLLSGFVLTYSYAEPAGGSGLKTSAKDFWIARIARIYPMYALALIIAFYPYLKSELVEHTSNLQFVAGLLCVPLLAQSWVPPIALAWNLPAWSLSVEAFFYTLFPWLAANFLRRLTPKAALLWAFMLVVVTDLGCYFVSQRPDMQWGIATVPRYAFLMDFPLWHLPTFLLGMALGRLFLLERARILGDKTFLLAGSIILTLAALQYKLPHICFSNLVLTPLFGLLIYSGGNCRGIVNKLLGAAWLVFLGEASYGIYILHVPLAYWCVWIWSRISGHMPGDTFIYLVVYLGVLLLFSCLAFALFEVPARTAVSRRLKLIFPKREMVLPPAGGSEFRKV